MKKYFFFLFFLLPAASILGQVTVVDDSLFSPSIDRTEKFYVILPDGYAKSQERYTTIYLLHGFNGDYTNWVKLTGLVTYLKEYNYIVVTPDAGNSWYTNSFTKKKMNYEDLIIQDLIPFIDKKYRTLQSKYDRAIVGLSMGGYGAAKFGVKYPNKFFFAGCLSPAVQNPSGIADSVLMARRSKASQESLRETFGTTRNAHWTNNDVFDLVKTVNPKTAPFFYIAVGSQDGIHSIITRSYDFASALREANIPFEFHESPGGHEWKLWDREIKIVLRRISVIHAEQR